MPKDQILIDCMDDVSIARNNQYINLHLYTGQLIQVSREVLKAVNKQMFPLSQDSSGEKKAEQIEGVDYVLVDVAKYNMTWPYTPMNAPIWRSSDGRVMPVTEMDDRYLYNAMRKVDTIIRSYPYTKNIDHYKQWREWFKLEKKRRGK